MATDFALALLASWLGVRLLGAGGGRAVRLWAYAFFALAAGAALGGASHGFSLYLGETAKVWTWRATTFSIGFASFFLLAGSAYGALRRTAAGWAATAAFVKLLVYLVWMASHDDFVYVIADYGPSMLAVLGLNLYLWVALGEGAGKWITAGVAVSFLAAGVQLSGFALHRHFNHNDLYHVVQMVGVWFFYRGARDLQDRPS